MKMKKEIIVGLILIFLTSCNIRQSYEYKEKEVVFDKYEDINLIKIKDDFAPIQIKGIDSQQIRVLYYEAENDDEYYEINKKDNGELIIQRIDEKNGQGIFILGEETNHEDVSLVIEIPKEWGKDLKVSCTYYGINIENLCLENLYVKNSDSVMSLENLLVNNKLKLQNSDGDSILQNLTVMKKIEILNEDGNIKGIINKTSNIYPDSSNMEIRANDGSVEIYFDSSKE